VITKFRDPETRVAEEENVLIIVKIYEGFFLGNIWQILTKLVIQFSISKSQNYLQPEINQTLCPYAGYIGCG
jgi:hypothetical protein